MDRSGRAWALPPEAPDQEETVADLLAGLGSPDSAEREVAIGRAMGALGAEALVVLLAEKDARVRAAAMAALAQRGEAAEEALVAGAGCCDRQVALVCLELLARLPGTGEVPPARRLLRHPDPALARAAAEVLGVRRDRGALPALLGALRGHPSPAQAAIHALTLLAEGAAVEPLRLLAREEPVLREQAEQAVKVIERRAAFRG